MAKICDHTSVGMLVWNDDKLLLIERAKFPFGYAIPAGHVDGDINFGDETNNHEAAYQRAAKRELKEEVGLDTLEIELVTEGRKENPCRREGGSWHYWKFYKVDVNTGGADVADKISRSLDETKKTGWYTNEQIAKLATRTEDYKAGKIAEADWEKNPGLEPVMYEWFKELKII